MKTRRLRMQVISDGTTEGTYLADADTGEALTIEGAVVHMDVCVQTARQSWQTPPVGTMQMIQGVLAFVEETPGIPAAPETNAQITITLPATPVENTGSSSGFRIVGKY